MSPQGSLPQAPRGRRTVATRLAALLVAAALGFSVATVIGGTRATPAHAVPLIDAPGLVSGPNGYQAFVLGSNGSLWRVGVDSTLTTWEPAWTNLGGLITSRPAAAFDGTTGWVFVKDLSGGLSYRRSSDAAMQNWNNWQSLGGLLTSGPTVVAIGTKLTVFARDLSNGLSYRTWTGSVWDPWKSMGGILTSAPAAATNGTRAAVFVRDLANGYAYRSSSDADMTGWNQWSTIGGIFTSDPAAARSGNDVVVFGRDLANGLSSKRSGNASLTSFPTWLPLGGLLTGAPAAVSDSNASSNPMAVMVRALDSSFAFQFYDSGAGGNGWSGWMGYPAFQQP